MYPDGLIADNIHAIRAAFRAEIENNPSPNRWLVDPAIQGLRRQTPVYHGTSRRFRKLPECTKDGIWLLEGDDAVWREIIPLDFLVDRVLSLLWDLDHGEFDKYRILKEFSERYEGVLIEDLSFICTQLDRISEAAFLLSFSAGARVGDSPAALGQPSGISWKENVESPAKIKSESLQPSDEVPQAVISISEAANEQQEALFHGPKAKSLISDYTKVQAAKSDSHLKKNGELALDILTNGRAAKCWVPGDGLAEMTRADYLLLTEEEHLQMAQAGNSEGILKPIVVRDEQFRRRRNSITRDSLFEDLLKCPPWKHVHVQQLAEGIEQLGVKAIPVSEAVHLWKKSVPEFSDQSPPMNMLNLSNLREGLWLSGLYKEYDMLFDACSFSDEEMLFHLKNPEGGKGNVGKEAVEFWGAADIKNCKQFMILAQRGAVSSYHMDNAGVWTWVTLEGNSDDPQECDEDVLKFWPIFPLDKLPKEDQTRYLGEFGLEGRGWRPLLPAGHKVPVLALIKGDTLIMPPGTVHAPITATDCLFVGGMCMHPKFVKRAIEVWHYLHKHPDATNEPAPRQSRAILDYINNMVHSDPVKYGFAPEELPKFDKECAEISNASLSCRCIGGCKTTNCNCVKYGQRCADGCFKHQQNGGCQNPFGCGNVPLLD